MIITRKDPITGKTNTMDLDATPKEFEDWMSGTLIQNAFPYLSADEREFIKTGIVAESWDSMFTDEAEDAHNVEFNYDCEICGREGGH